jgi:hypothetical protein
MYNFANSSEPNGIKHLAFFAPLGPMQITLPHVEQIYLDGLCFDRKLLKHEEQINIKKWY